jgi:hypothetical protein
MKAAIIVGCVLLLATGTAHARSFETYDCGKVWIEEAFPKYFSPVPGRRCDGGPCDGKAHYFDADDVASGYDRRRVDRYVRFRGDVLFYKGRKCRKLTDEEYN